MRFAVIVKKGEFINGIVNYANIYTNVNNHCYRGCDIFRLYRINILAYKCSVQMD